MLLAGDGDGVCVLCHNLCGAIVQAFAYSRESIL